MEFVAGAGKARDALRPVRVVAFAAAAILALAGCSSSGTANANVKRAESKVSDKQKALADAQAELAAKSAAFCKSSASYITALDRYGDILHQTDATVGDVKPLERT